MSSAYFVPLFFLGNGLGTHYLLQKYVPSYKTITYRSQQDTLARWNAFLMQMFLIGGYAFVKNDEDIFFFAQMFAAYFLTDIIHMLFYCYEPIYYIHHSISYLILTFGPSYFGPADSHALYFSGILLELTTPPISLAWVLSKLGYKPRGYSLLKGFAYLNFFFVRIVYFPYYWYMYLTLVPKIIIAPFHILNAYWFYSMTGYLVKSLKE
jgi:hypothetical protein